MSSPLQNNITNLQNILDTINNLPEAAVASGVYTTGAVTVAGDANLAAENIKSGVSIFGVSGTYEGSGSGDSLLMTEEELFG